MLNLHVIADTVFTGIGISLWFIFKDGNKQTKNMVWVIAACLIIAIFYTNVLITSFDNLKAENVQLKAINAQFQAENTALKAEIEQLKEENARLDVLAHESRSKTCSLSVVQAACTRLATMGALAGFQDSCDDYIKY